MSKLYENYKKLKEKNSEKLYLFKSGMFYIFLEDDAKQISSKLNLKITKLNDTVVKCGFPLNSLEKYSLILDKNNIEYEIIDNYTLINSKDEYINNQNVQNKLDYIKKLDINKLTPIKAFEIISELQMILRRFKLMKRLGNLYEDTYKIENIMQVFNEVCRNTKNKNRVNKYKEFKCMYIYQIYDILKNMLLDLIMFLQYMNLKKEELLVKICKIKL